MATAHPSAIFFDDREVQRALRDLRRTGVPKVSAGALNRTAFEVLEAEREHVGRIFNFAGPSTKKFLADRGFRFKKATPTRQQVEIFPREKTGKILEDHFSGEVFGAAEGERLSFGDQLAIPVEAKRGVRGKVPKRQRPSEVVKPGGRGFVSQSRKAILQRQGRRRRQKVRVLFALTRRAKVSSTFKFFEVAFRKAREVFPAKVRREFEKLRLGK